MSISCSPENLKYRAEGNVCIVISLVKEGTVLRLKKQEIASQICTNAVDVQKVLESEIEVLNNVLKPVLGESFVNIPLIVFLRAEDISIVNERIRSHRPADRMHKSIKEEDTYVSMLPDYCSLPPNLRLMPTCGFLLSIEIKPKQGFIKEELKTCLHKCRYCMMQEYKLKKCRISSKSGYCPMDLFSGCSGRMVHALNMLLRTPQNNLRIFKDQELVYSEENRNNLHDLLSDFIKAENNRILDLFCDLIVQALVKPFPYGQDKTRIPQRQKFSQNCANAYTEWPKHDLCHELPQYCVLERILSCQLLDDMDIADVYQLYSKVKGNTTSQDFFGCYSKSEIPPCIGEVRKNASESDDEFASRKVWEFLLALMMKDCSVMITIQRLAPNSSSTTDSQNVVQDKSGNLYVFSVSIADLDTKPLSKVEKVYNDLHFILEALNAS